MINMLACLLGLIWGWTVGESSFSCVVQRQGQGRGTASAEAQPGAFWSPPCDMEKTQTLPWLLFCEDCRSVGDEHEVSV